ncbi:aspartate/glutamate racemase family protein [Gallaecimonas xiamenensis]|uniref:Aspartate racemase n=1 Tax=Gallaecimonas xiamenensis 3-C-1 TaxID=745411 RepID=K2KH46_9GAMM|nr:aspartate/glutamate racemase family protein [Gallaecimonas xiamenensis]EKE76595.1 aspartate racemase [Gallaecimonas xiamenensis 3-C-1]
MKTIGLLGGMSWESTQGYYSAINRGVRARCGGLHSAKIALYSVDFAPLAAAQHQGDWAGAAALLVEGAKRVEAAGADFLLLCTNTMHKLAPELSQALSIPLVHIADATGEALVQAGVRRVGLLGTAFTMEQDFYKGRLAQGFGLEVLVPDESDRALVHDVIYQELCQGRIEAASRAQYLQVIDRLAARGAQAVILGCTEIGLLVGQGDTPVPLFDTTALHAQKAVALATAQLP